MEAEIGLFRRRKHKEAARETAGFQFEDVLSNFPGRVFVFVSIEIYADESGTHDETGKRRGARVAVINGLAGWKTSWATLTRKWRQCLKRNDVDCFHASDLANSTRYPNGIRNARTRLPWHWQKWLPEAQYVRLAGMFQRNGSTTKMLLRERQANTRTGVVSTGSFGL
jgi:hypothetical protein